MDDVCIACSRCMVGFNRKVGEFNRYKDQDAELVGILNYADCPGVEWVQMSGKTTNFRHLNLETRYDSSRKV